MADETITAGLGTERSFGATESLRDVFGVEAAGEEAAGEGVIVEVDELGEGIFVAGAIVT